MKGKAETATVPLPQRTCQPEAASESTDLRQQRLIRLTEEASGADRREDCDLLLFMSPSLAGTAAQAVASWLLGLLRHRSASIGPCSLAHALAVLPADSAADQR